MVLGGTIAGPLAGLLLTVTTQNVQQGLPPDQARHDIRQAAQHSSILITQEMGLRRALRFAPPGWGTAHAHGLRAGDCATYWNRALWRKDRTGVRLITAAPFKAGTRYAQTTILHRAGHPRARIAVVCVHMITRSWERRGVYARGMVRLANILATLPGHVVVGGDWNRGWGRRVPLDTPYRTVRPPHPTGGGARIDYWWWRTARLERVTVVGRTYSDHNGVRVRVRFR